MREQFLSRNVVSTSHLKIPEDSETETENIPKWTRFKKKGKARFGVHLK